MTAAVQVGDTISVHYTGKFENGETFDSSVGGEPLKFTVGAGQLIKGFDQAVQGLKAGEKTSVSIPPAEAYGERREDMIVEIPRKEIPEEIQLKQGEILHLEDPNGNPVPALIHEVREDVVRMDVNHPMAGKTLNFEIEVVETGLESEKPKGHHHGDDHECTCGGGDSKQ